MNTTIPLLNTYPVIGFDLDGTLHEYEAAATSAAEAVFTYLLEEFGVPRHKTRADYTEILATAQAGHFTEPLPSRTYRARRFRCLLQASAILPHQHLTWLLDIYEESFVSNLAEKPGATALLRAAKATGKRTVVISEGPQDAQVKTLATLGLADMVDLLVTSSSVGRSKSDGLFQVALDRLGCQPSDMAYIGDNFDRDCIPCAAAGITSILFDDTHRKLDAAFRIERLDELIPYLTGLADIPAAGYLAVD